MHSSSIKPEWTEADKHWLYPEVQKRIKILETWIKLFEGLWCKSSCCYSRKGKCVDKHISKGELRACMTVRNILKIGEYFKRE